MKIGRKHARCSLLFSGNDKSHAGEQYYRAIVLIDEEVLQSRSCCVCGLGSSFAFVSELTIAIRIDNAVYVLRVICSSSVERNVLLFFFSTDLRSSRCVPAITGSSSATATFKFLDFSSFRLGLVVV